MPIPAPTNTVLVNPGFEDGTTSGWSTVIDVSGTASASPTRPYNGGFSAFWVGAEGGDPDTCVWTNDAVGTVVAGQVVGGSVQIALDDRDDTQNQGEARIYWYNSAGGIISFKSGTLIRGNNSSYRLSTVSDTAPAGAATVRFAVWTRANSNGGVRFDSATWNYTYNRTATLVQPADGTSYVVGANIPLRVNIGGTSPAILRVDYLDDITVIGSSSTAPYDVNVSTLTSGAHPVKARVYFVDDTFIDSNVNNITVAATPVPPTLREYKASNSYTYLIAENISGLASAIPSTALVTGVEAQIDYDLTALVRSLDTGVPPEQSTVEVAFDITDGAVLEAILLTDNGSDYTAAGSNVTETIPLDRSDFTVVEEGTSEGKKWTVLSGTEGSVVIGGEDQLFGLQPLALADFVDRSLGFRFYPNLAAKPAYADSGDACFRFFINKLRVSVYFNAGSAEYYFASPDKTQIIKGMLVAASVDEGNFSTGDASGTLQLQPTLEVIAGTQTYIGANWTIHSANPPSDSNQIGTVAAAPNGVGMSYNGLPSYKQVMDNRSRYVFITANYYADKKLDSIYGAHGLPRAFAYNKEWFYKIYTQPDPIKDSPRHVAYHHGHLALGYDEGRVDISVIGQPYNFSGTLGASSFSIGTKVVGLQPLSGTILGVFGSKSIWGISGTTVDNFATQVISPNIGAVEYTIADMGYPVYANAYGVYTLSQTQQYGDYLGTPMSQDVSPWLRPRLVRKVTSDKEVVVAWPVRSKNQYRLAFSDGYVMSMTLNGAQATPTFSFQKYFITDPDSDPDPTLPLLEYTAMVPAAVSSQLDDGGQERIHIADLAKYKEQSPPIPPDPPGGYSLQYGAMQIIPGDGFNDWDAYDTSIWLRTDDSCDSQDYQSVTVNSITMLGNCTTYDTVDEYCSTTFANITSEYSEVPTNVVYYDYGNGELGVTCTTTNAIESFNTNILVVNADVLLVNGDTLNDVSFYYIFSAG